MKTVVITGATSGIGLETARIWRQWSIGDGTMLKANGWNPRSKTAIPSES